ncbi:MAG: hypothetical protein IT370_03860 [Deltaproteobacteria bacterium]|nr:hypothetical protein [Deltaproteobacteria bacterium]
MPHGRSSSSAAALMCALALLATAPAACTRSPRAQQTPSPHASVSPFPIPTTLVIDAGAGLDSPIVLDDLLVLFPASQGPELAGPSFGNDPIASYFRPELSEATRARTLLGGFLAAHAPGVAQSKLDQRYLTYKSQWVGFMVGTRRLLYGNFFCDDFGHAWKTSPLSVDDGGDCFLQVVFEPATDAFFQLMINGNA